MRGPKEGDVFCMCADASVEEGEHKVLGGLGHDMAVKVLPARGSFFVRHGQGHFEVSANTNVAEETLTWWIALAVPRVSYGLMAIHEPNPEQLYDPVNCFGMSKLPEQM